MAYQLGQQIEMLSKYSNVDLLYGPYQDKKAACDNIPENTRDFGRTVLILENKEYKEYWWKDDLSDSGLIPKITINEGSTETVQSDWNETNEISPAYIQNKPDLTNWNLTIYESVAQACTYIPESQRKLGRTILIGKNIGTEEKPEYINVQEFWWSNGIKDADLMVKTDLIILDDTSIIATMADDDGINLNIETGQKFIWKGSYKYWDDGMPHSLVTNGIYICFYNEIMDYNDYKLIFCLTTPYISNLNVVGNIFPKEIRYIGMTVNVSGEEYWWKDGIENENLVKKIVTAGKDILGLTKTTSEITDPAGYKPCPIIEGIPYYEKVNLDATSNYITIIDDTFIENLDYKNSEGEWGTSTQSINFPKNKIIFYNGTHIVDFYTNSDTVLGTLLPGNFYITKASDYKAYNYNDELKTVVWGECINLEYQTYGYDKLSRKYSISTEIDYTKDVIEIHNNNSEENIELPFNYPTDEMLKGKHIKIFYFNDSDVDKKLSITSTDGKCYIVEDSSITSNITYNIESGGKCIIIDVYILDENLIINVIKNINKIS